jgi:crotonobetainyl-CoA:carnitine CoA-transferase CaiB-like acyl-CoA transferase
LAESEIPAGPILDVRDALAQTAAGPMLLSDEPGESPTGVRSVALEPSETYQPAQLLPPPQLGEHTLEVLSRLLQLEEDELLRLKRAGVIGPG